MPEGPIKEPLGNKVVHSVLFDVYFCVGVGCRQSGCMTTSVEEELYIQQTHII